MPDFKNSTVLDLERLLNLFPVAALKGFWESKKGTKEEICRLVATQKQFNRLLEFLDENIQHCKQHVFVFAGDKQLKVLPSLPVKGAERVLSDGNLRALYVIRVKFRVLLEDPLEQKDVEFLWPIVTELVRGYLVARVVVLEKDIGSYFDNRKFHISNRSMEEKEITLSIAQQPTHQLRPADLHAGTKKLWAQDFMDAFRTQYKKPLSTASEAMDEEMGIKSKNPQLYGILSGCTLFMTLFKVDKVKRCGVSVFSIDPSKGYLAFPRYSEGGRSTDFVIDEILRNN